MLREQAKLFNKLSIGVDILVIFASLVLAYHFRAQFKGELNPLHDYLWVLIVVIPVWFYLLNRNGLYSSIRRWSVFDIVTRLFNLHLLGGLLVASVIYFVDREKYSRGLYLAFLGTTFVLLTMACFGVVALLSGEIGRWLNRSSAGNRIGQVAGGVLIALGLRLAWPEN